MSGSTVVILCIAVAAVVGLSFFLFRLWQKKKREEQYARLLKLFEEDDELELELGLRDWAGWYDGGRFLTEYIHSFVNFLAEFLIFGKELVVLAGIMINGVY